MVRLRIAAVVALAACFVFGLRASHGAFPPQPERVARPQQDKTADKNKTVAPASSCSRLTPAMLQKVLGQPFDDPSETKSMPAYQDAWDSSRQYSSKKPGSQGGVRVDMLIYTEASAAEAKQTFDKAAVFFTDRSKPKPSIGDSAYWQSTDENEPTIHVLKRKVHLSIGMEPANEKQLKDLATAVAAGI